MFYMVGQTTRLGILSSHDSRFQDYNPIEGFVIDVLLSMIITFSVSGILACLYLIDLSVPVLIILLVVGYIAWEFPKKSIQKADDELHTDQIVLDSKFIAALVVLVIFSALLVLQRWSLFPWPQTAGTDTYSHLADINEILFRNGTPYILYYYSYLFHSTIAVLCLFSGESAFWVLRNLYILQIPYSMFISFLFLHFVTKSKTISILGTCTTIAVYEHGGLLAPYHPFPIMSAFMFLYTIFVSCYILQPRITSFALILISYIVASLLYTPALIFSIPLILYLLASRDFLPFGWSIVPKIIFSMMISVAGILIVLYYVVFPFTGFESPTFEILSSVILTYNLESSMLHFTLAYSLPQAVSLISGIICCILLIKIRRSTRPSILGEANFTILGVLGLTYLLIFFMPMLYTHRIELFLRPIFSTLIVISCLILANIVVNIASYSVKKGLPTISSVRIKKEYLLVVFVILILIPVSYEKWERQNEYMSTEEPKNPELEELEAMLWIAEHTSPEDYILTDLATGHMIRGIIYRNASVSFMLDGQAKSYKRHPDLLDLVLRFFNCTASESEELITAIQTDSTMLNYTRGITYILVTPRTNAWLNRANNGRVGKTAPYEIEMNPNDPVWTKFQSSIFSQVFSSGNATVYEIIA